MWSRSCRSSCLASGLVAALLALIVADDARACDELSPATRADRCDPLFVPRLPVEGPSPFLWTLATHDERRDYLLARGVPRSLADKLAVGGFPLGGQLKAEDAGWLLVPQAAAVRLQARF